MFTCHIFIPTIDFEPIFFIQHEKCIVRRNSAKIISRNMFLTNSQSSLELRDNIQQKQNKHDSTLKYSSRTPTMSDTLADIL